MSMEGHYDLLRNPVNFAWAVNCVVEEDTVTIGALYLEPQIPNSPLRLAHNDEYVDVLIPDEYLNKGENMRAWNVDLPINKPPTLS